MIHKDNPHMREEGQPEALLRKDSTLVDTKNDARGGRKEAADGDPNALAEEKFVGTVFDLAHPDQAKSIEEFKRAFGSEYCEVEPLGHARAVLKLYPGGAGRLP